MFWASIGAIGMTGLVSALILLVGTWNDTTGKILLTTFAVGGYGLLASLSLRVEAATADPLRGLNVGQSLVGVIASFAGLLIAAHMIWSERYLDWLFSSEGNEVRWEFTMLSIAFTTVWIAQLRSYAARVTDLVLWTSRSTLGMVILAELMVLYVMWADNIPESEAFWRVLAALTVLAVTSTLITFILRKLSSGGSDGPQRETITSTR